MTGVGRLCAVEDCGRALSARGWCRTHYEQWRITGSPFPRSIEDRFWSRVDKGDGTGCWLWTGRLDPNGYGRFDDVTGLGSNIPAYAWVYKRYVGPIPDGLELDHVCHSEAVERGECAGGLACVHRLCIRPDHLEPVTHAENSRRGMSGRRMAAKTHCPQGHPYDETNTYVNPKGGRVCRTCKKERQRIAALTVSRRSCAASY